MGSLRSRLLLANLVLLPLFLGATGLYLDRGYRLSLHSAAEERLQIYVLTLLAEAEYGHALAMPDNLLEVRLNQHGSGLYAMVSDQTGTVLWRSQSALALENDDVGSSAGDLEPGQSHFRVQDDFYSFVFAVVWQTETGNDVPLRFRVIEAIAPSYAQLNSYRRSLALWLGGSALALLLGQILVLYWGLRPLALIARDIAAIRTGAKDRLSGTYPVEVQALTGNLNALLDSEERRRERTRNTLADLAHSLKTPLAVIRSAGASDPAEFQQLVAEQVDRMEETVNYQLQRTTAGTHSLLRQIEIFPVVDRLVTSLAKVHVDKDIDFELHIAEHATFRGDERDLMELLGNLIDNACKYCVHRVRIVARSEGQRLELIVEDDGCGIPVDLRSAILRRGVRADTSRPGQGIGLAVAADIARGYGGKLIVEDSELGGALLRAALR
ncbi:MAG: ATP-binding protein [Gammaproteobacteria bacterium]|nr:ATP-binding protein [Gammaproteobacteria bacterium]